MPFGSYAYGLSPFRSMAPNMKATSVVGTCRACAVAADLRYVRQTWRRYGYALRAPLKQNDFWRSLFLQSVEGAEETLVEKSRLPTALAVAALLVAALVAAAPQEEANTTELLAGVPREVAPGLTALEHFRGEAGLQRAGPQVEPCLRLWRCSVSEVKTGHPLHYPYQACSGLWYKTARVGRSGMRRSPTGTAGLHTPDADASAKSKVRSETLQALERTAAAPMNTRDHCLVRAAAKAQILCCA